MSRIYGGFCELFLVVVSINSAYITWVCNMTTIGAVCHEQYIQEKYTVVLVPSHTLSHMIAVSKTYEDMLLREAV